MISYIIHGKNDNTTIKYITNCTYSTLHLLWINIQILFIPSTVFHSSVFYLLKIQHRIKDPFQHIGQERREISFRNRFESFVFHRQRGLEPFIPNNYQPDFERRKSPRIVPSARAFRIAGRKFKNLVGNPLSFRKRRTALLLLAALKLVFHHSVGHSFLAAYITCLRWKSHLLTNFVTCPHQFPRTVPVAQFPSSPSLYSLAFRIKLICIFLLFTLLEPKSKAKIPIRYCSFSKKKKTVYGFSPIRDRFVLWSKPLKYL